MVEDYGTTSSDRDCFLTHPLPHESVVAKFGSAAQLTAVIALCAATLAAIHAPASAQVINEFHADPAFGLAGDANGDGVRDAFDDEFVEIVNDTGADLNLGGWTLSDLLGVRYTFPDGTIVQADCAIVVFGGGSPTGSFGNAVVQTAVQLLLNNRGDTITLADGDSSIVAQVAYGTEGGIDQSFTRDPDITGSFIRHPIAVGSGGRRFSPGTRLDGTQFSGCPRDGDCNGDGVLDLFDFAAFNSCVDDPGGLAKPDCACFDLDNDGMLGLIDWGILQAALSR